MDQFFGSSKTSWYPSLQGGGFRAEMAARKSSASCECSRALQQKHIWAVARNGPVGGSVPQQLPVLGAHVLKDKHAGSLR